MIPANFPMPVSWRGIWLLGFGPALLLDLLPLEAILSESGVRNQAKPSAGKFLVVELQFFPSTF